MREKKRKLLFIFFISSISANENYCVWRDVPKTFDDAAYNCSLYLNENSVGGVLWTPSQASERVIVFFDIDST